MSFLVQLFVVALTALALNPKDPSDACNDRFIYEKDIKACQKKVSDPGLDWYASQYCEKMLHDEFFMKCFDEIKGAQFFPRAVEDCEKLGDAEDQAKLDCLLSAKNKPDPSKRAPAAKRKKSDKAFYQK